MSAKYILIVTMTLVLAACSPGAPRQIASYPKTNPGWVEPGSQVYIHSAMVVLAVNDADLAAEQTNRLVSIYGGYLENTQTWYANGCKAITLDVQIPATNFDNFHRELLGLGVLVTEDVSGFPAQSYLDKAWNKFSRLSIELRPRVLDALPVNPPEWRPIWHPYWSPLQGLAQTFQKAVSVSLSIFGFLADLLIWIVVVLGPFALLGWLCWKLAKRLKTKN